VGDGVSAPSLAFIINALGGPDKETAAVVGGVIGKKLVSLGIDNESLCLRFDDGAGVAIFDDGQSCCEHRHMSTDDDLSRFVGALFVSVELRDGPKNTDDHGEDHDQQFMIVKTSLGEFTVVNHNEHNGYYGGFIVRAEAL